MKRKKGPAKRHALEEKRRRKSWEKFVREDRDYDYHFIWVTLRYKLERTRDHIVKHNLIRDAKKVGKQIDSVVKCLKRLEADNYWSDPKTLKTEHERKLKDFDKAFGLMRQHIWGWWD